MTILSKENAKARLEEFRILLKYMPFLQKNGFSDCGRGQIMGQMSLIQEFLSDSQTNDEILNLQYKDSVIPHVPNIIHLPIMKQINNLLMVQKIILLTSIV